MIVSALGSGFGNQMFQYACGRAVASALDLPFAIEGSGFARDPLRTFELPQHFDLTRFVVTSKSIEAEARKQFGFVGSLLNRYRAPDAFGLKVCNETAFTFDPAVFSVTDGTLLRGYRQSEKYFKAIETTIRQDFVFQSTPDRRNLDLIDELSETCSVAVHVRRGDYVSDPRVASNHGVCPPSYYERAVALIGEKLDAPKLYVFSDDPDWVSAHMQFDYPMTYVSWNRGPQSFEDMRLMSHCRHNIIANSSFSWWGAWLNRHEDKVVVAPTNWFNEIAHDTSDLVPGSWVRL